MVRGLKADAADVRQSTASPKGRYTSASARAEPKQADSNQSAPRLATANATKSPKTGFARSPATPKKETKGGADRRPGKSKARAKPTGEPSKPKTSKLSRLESVPGAWSAEPESAAYAYHEDEDDLLRHTAAIEKQNLEEEAISTLLNHLICHLEAEEAISILVDLPTPLPAQSHMPPKQRQHNN